MSANLSGVCFLHLWAIRDADPSPYDPPECRPKVATGYVYGHPEHPDGSPITTGILVEHDYPKRTIRSGRRAYRLGTIDPGYVQYMKQNGIVPTTFRVEDFLEEVSWQPV